jgi:hypothetical protein
MLEREGILLRDESTGRLDHVYFCDNDESEFEKIVNLIKSEQAGFKGDFRKIVLFEDDDDTRNKDEIDTEEGYSGRVIREKFRYKQ